MTRLYIERGDKEGGRQGGAREAAGEGAPPLSVRTLPRSRLLCSPPPSLPLFAPALHNKAAGWENINLGMFCNLAARGVATYNGTLLLLRCYSVRTMFVSCLFLLLVVVVVVVAVVGVVQIGGVHVCSPATKINISKVTKWRREDSSSRITLDTGTGVPRRGGGCYPSIDTFLFSLSLSLSSLSHTLLAY